MVEPPSSRTGSPHDHLQQRGSKIDAFRGELVDVFASIGGRLDLVNDPLDSEFLKAVGEDIRGDPSPPSIRSANECAPLSMRSLITNSDQRSQKISTETFRGYPDRLPVLPSISVTGQGSCERRSGEARRTT